MYYYEERHHKYFQSYFAKLKNMKDYGLQQKAFLQAKSLSMDVGIA